MPLKLDDIVPNFERTSIASNIDFYSWAGDSWVILFSYPRKFTNIDKLELAKIGALKSEFDKRNVKAIVLSIENLNSYNRWLSKIEATQGSTINYPILLDSERKIFDLYGIITPSDREKEAIRSIFIINPDRKLCGYIVTPVTTEYNFDELIEKIDSVQLIDRSSLPPSPTSFGKIRAKYIQDVRKFLQTTEHTKVNRWVPPPTDLIEEPQQIISDTIAPAQTPADRANLLTRYSNLDCPDTTPINIAFSIYAQLLIEPPDAETKPVTIQDTGASQLPQIEVVLRARGFDIEGSNTQIMEIDRERDSEVRFMLKPSQLGEQQIRVAFYQYGKPISEIRHNILVGDLQSDRQVSQPDKDPIVEFKINPNIPPPDLEICIELDRHDDRTLYFELHSIKENIDYNHAKFGQIELKDSPNEKMQAVYQELSAFAAIDPRKFQLKSTTLVRSVDRDDRDKAEQRIAAVGNQLWDTLIPQELQAEYWQFKAKGVKSILITSDEPWVPWEIIKPYRRHPQNVEEQEPFWCEQFAISRWLSGAGTADELPIELVIPVAPNIVNLPAVAAEITFLQQLNMIRPDIKTIQPIGGSLALKDYLKEQPNFSLLHFACHGGFNSTLPNDSAIQLSDNDCLRPSDIHLYFARPFTRPLIFINACDGGRQGFSFTGLGGWAQCLVKARVGAFAGAMWEVNDTLALEFAKHFYQALLQDKQTIGEAFQQARAVIRQQAPYNSTWLAYTLYADPEARLAQTAKVAA